MSGRHSRRRRAQLAPDVAAAAVEVAMLVPRMRNLWPALDDAGLAAKMDDLADRLEALEDPASPVPRSLASFFRMNAGAVPE